jgi:serine protease Do
LAAALLATTALTGGIVSASAQTAPVNPPGQIAPRAVLPDFSGLVTQVKPAVVSVTTTVAAEQAEGSRPDLPFPFNRMIPRVPHAGGQWGGPGGGQEWGGGQGNGQEPHEGMREARGSGFIIRPDGLIVTNNHVVKDASSVSVTLDDGTELKATVLGTDPRTDIAVLKIDAGHPLPFIQLGNSADVHPGEWVVAMGNPFGLGGTVTAGIVSAVSRDIGAGPYDQFIQVDAPINRGNSGGPLFTQEGKVIGMNTAIFSPSGGSIGIGFAIPSDMIRTVTSQLIATGHVTRGYAGVAAQAVDPAMAKALRLPETGGALLANVVAGSPAAKAGLEAGDVVEAVNGKKVASPRDLAIVVAGVTPGDEAKFQIVRDGQHRDIAVRVAEQPAEQGVQARADTSHAGGRLGLALSPLTPEARQQLNVPEGLDGVVVRDVRPGSPAEEAGLREGDVIVGIGSQKARSPSELTKAIQTAASSKDEVVALRVLRDGQVEFVGVTLNKAAANKATGDNSAG